MFYRFPKNFLWGTATSSHQVEGGNFNDWSEWEIKNAKFKSQSAKSRSWPEYLLERYLNPLKEENYISGRACDHYNRYEEDFDIVKRLSNNAHRFSIEWSRIEPREGEWNEKEIGHYRKVLLALKERNIEPFVTLWHWTLPVWFSQKGGFENPRSSFYFGRYAEKVVRELGGLVNYWITINEPLVIAGNGYLRGIWPPQRKNIFRYFRVLRNLAAAHKNVYQIIKSIKQDSQVGIAYNLRYFEASPNKFFNRVFKYGADYLVNRRFLEEIGEYQNFIGCNYYFYNRVNFNPLRPIKSFKVKADEKNRIVSDLGWEVYPEGIYHVLKDLKKYNLPIYITENGLADARDKYRADFIKEHLYWIWRAMNDEGGVDPVRSSAIGIDILSRKSEAASPRPFGGKSGTLPLLQQMTDNYHKTSNGVNIRGYFHWSLLDNFEWDKGFWPRFGLVEVDYETMERKVKDSALVYADICGNNGVEI